MKSLSVLPFFFIFHLLKYKVLLVVGDEVAGGAATQELPERDRQPIQTIKGIQGCVKFFILLPGGKIIKTVGEEYNVEKKGKGGAISLALCYWGCWKE